MNLIIFTYKSAKLSLAKELTKELALGHADIFCSTVAYPCKNDWTTQVREDLEEFGMSEDLKTQ